MSYARVVLLLGPDEVHVWYRETGGASAEDVQRACRVLSTEERRQCSRYHRRRDSRDYALAHDLLRRSLSRYAPVSPPEWQFIRDGNGKPRLETETLSFNLAHSRNVVACAVARAMPVGIDVERTDGDIEVAQLAAGFFSASEGTAVTGAASNRQTLFFELWTLKEAFLKAIGLGLSHPLSTFSFVLNPEDGHIEFEAPPGYDGAEWSFALYAPAADTRLAVAAHAPSHAVRWRAHTMHLDEHLEDMRLIRFSPTTESSSRSDPGAIRKEGCPIR